MPRLCLLGQVFVDVSMAGAATSLRLGGVIHAARAAWALGIEYSVAAILPAYLEDSTRRYLGSLACSAFGKVAVVQGSPNTMLIGDVSEAGPQGYMDLLRSQREFSDVSPEALRDLSSGATDLLCFPDVDWLPLLLDQFPTVPTHVDSDPYPALLSHLARVPKLATMIASTSAGSLSEVDGRSIARMESRLKGLGADILIKENRGGSYVVRHDSRYESPAFPGPVVHSVGVGDAFDVSYVSRIDCDSPTVALRRSAMLATNYAMTTDDAAFQNLAQATQRMDEELLGQLAGIRIPWDVRPSVNVYMAGPDFPEVDTTAIDDVEAVLRYHNFTPRRPIAENGLLHGGASPSERRSVVAADLSMLVECTVLVAILLTDDPGTMIEFAIANERGIPTIVYDPNDLARNPMLTELADKVCPDLNALVSAIFESASRV